MKINLLKKTLDFYSNFFLATQKFGRESLRVERLRNGDAIAWTAGHVILFVVFSFYAFNKNIGWLFPGGDGAYPIHILINQRIWSQFSFGLSWNPLQGLGDMDFPLNTWLVPGYALPAIILGTDSASTHLFQVASHAIFALELFVATLCLSKSLGVGWCASFSAAWLTPLLLLPYFGVPLLYPLILLAPHVATAIADSTLVLAAFVWVGKRDSLGVRAPLRDILLTTVILGFLAHMTLFSPILIAMLAQVIGFGLLGLTVCAEKGERVTKMAVLIFSLLVLVATGFASFVYGMFDYTAAHMLSNRLELDTMLKHWSSISNWFYPPASTARNLIPLAAIGFIMATVFGEKKLRAFSYVVAAIMATIFGIGAIVVETDKWRLPSLIYYEIMAIPLYVIFAAYGVVSIFRLIIAFVIKLRGSIICIEESAISRKFMVFALAVPVVAFYGTHHVNNIERVWGPLPPKDTPITLALQEKIGLAPGNSFHGRVATLLMIDKVGPVSWNDLIVKHGNLINITGNDHHWTGLWPKQVPTLFKYSSLISPPSFLTEVHLLGQPTDIQFRNAIMLRRADYRALGMFGVRYVITDTHLPPPFRLELSEKADSYVVYLYEVPHANLGTYSPVETVVANSYAEAMDQLADHKFDPERKVILFESMPVEYQGALSPANSITLRTIRGGLEIEARSDGNSMVLIPFEFSRCLTLESEIGGNDQPQLLRADAVLTGVLFHTHLKAKISYFTSPFHGSGCRIEDARDFSQLAH